MKLKYHIVIINIETFHKQGSGLDKLWRNPVFVKHVIVVVWDKAHCVSKH
jgi:hypothetical protein